MSCSGCHASLDCPGDEAFPYTLTPLAPFPWVVNCPEGVDCFSALSVTMDCCDSPTTVDIPAGTSAADRLTLLNQLIQQCLFLQNVCDDGGGGGPDDPPPSPPSAFWLNAAQTGSKECSSTFGGGTYYFTVAAGSFMAESLADANALALDAATKFVKDNHFCANPPCLCPCADVATVINIPLVGGHGPFTYVIDSGVLPTGMTLSIVGGLVKLTGTPTVTGLTTVTLKIFDAVGGYLLKTMAVHVLKISTTSPLPAFTAGVPYSYQLTGEGGTGDYVFTLTSGSLPSGLGLSTAGLISGTPIGAETTFTVGMIDRGLGQTSPCTKEFDLPGLGPIYYKLETTAGGIAVDANGVNNTDANTGARTSVAGKIGQAWLFDTVLGVVGTAVNYSILTDKTIITSKTITIRLWVKAVVDLYYYGSSSDFIFQSRYFSIMSASSGTPGEGQVYVWNDGFGTIGYADATNFNDGNWHRILYTYDATTGESVYQVDDGPRNAETIAEGLITENSLFLPPVTPDPVPVCAAAITPQTWQPEEPGPPGGPFPGNPGAGNYALFDMDEICVIPDVVWDVVDSTYDWNGGAGRTFPDLP